MTRDATFQLVLTEMEELAVRNWDDSDLVGRLKNWIMHLRLWAESEAGRQDAKILRAALVQLVGVDGREELEEMETVLRAAPAPAEDKAAAIDGIHALLATLPLTL